MLDLSVESSVMLVSSLLNSNDDSRLFIGVAVSKSAVEMTKEDYDSQMNPNIWGCFTVAQAAVKWVHAATRESIC